MALAGCSTVRAEADVSKDEALAAIARVEQESGGRLGVALRANGGDLKLSYRGDERFALCSTFKVLLAARVLQLRESHALENRNLTYDESDIAGWAPYAKEHLAEGAMSVEAAAEYAVKQSDNTAANLLLDATGGPSSLTRWFGRNGDSETRLDRNEPELNSNDAGDPRDTTTPEAISESFRRALFGNILDAEYRGTLLGWMAESPFGTARLRAGMPQAWPKGSKTGTCAKPGQGEVNDVAWFQTPDGEEYILAAYLDRPAGDKADAERALAKVGRIAADWVSQQD
nr:class A beta-lactamase [Altericroceibacterium endophyticum]